MHHIPSRLKQNNRVVQKPRCYLLMILISSAMLKFEIYSTSCMGHISEMFCVFLLFFWRLTVPILFLFKQFCKD